MKRNLQRLAACAASSAALDRRAWAAGGDRALLVDRTGWPARQIAATPYFGLLGEGREPNSGPA